MDIKPSTLVKLLLPLTPLILKTLLLNALNLSANSSKQDARTEVIVTIIRKIASVSKPLDFTQRLSLKDSGVKGKLWISKVTIPAPLEADALDAIKAAIKELGDGSETFTSPAIGPVEAEWTGFRAGVGKEEPRPELPEAEQYTNLMKETTSPVTVLYFHGGAYFLMDPASHRITTAQLAKLTGGRCLSVRYRLAPQYPFPAQLLDAFISYLYLLSPDPSAYHTPVSPSSIIFSGDSAGGNLALALSLLITTLIRTGHSTISFHGQRINLAVPAGVALNSPWTDVSHALPSIHAYAQYDYLEPPTLAAPPPPSPIWPTTPPRAEIFCNASIITHPLVSPLAARSDFWSGHPPTFMCTGYEMLTDSILITARRMSQSQSKSYVELVGYEGMPHCFLMVFPTTAVGKHCLQRWADFCLEAVTSPKKLKEKKSSAAWIRAKSNPLSSTEVSFEEISDLGDEKVDALMAEMKVKAVGKERREVAAWEKGLLKEQKGGSESTGAGEAAAVVESRAKL